MPIGTFLTNRLGDRASNPLMPGTSTPREERRVVNEPLARRSRWRASLAALALAGPLSAAAEPIERVPAPAAFVGVGVIPLDGPRVLADHTVIVEGGRIVALGPAAQMQVPEGARVIDGRGRYLLPGLVDMHVHLDHRLGSRPDFGDAPLYLAHGVTTVLNLRGEAEHLALRERIAAGELLAPTLLTSGDFINEPRVRTPEEVEQEVERQAGAGFDVLKFHEVFDLETRAMLTTEGLSREAYRRLIASARERGILLLGHLPERFGVEEALAARQSLAHANAYLFGYFWPHKTRAFGIFRWLALVSAGMLATAAVAWLGIAAVGRGRPGGPSAGRSVGLALVVLAMIATAALLGRELADLDWLGGRRELRAFTAAGAFLLVLAATTLRLGAASLRRGAKRVVRASALATILGAVGLSASLAYWLPLAWRSSERGLEHVAVATARSGISVVTTLTVENVFAPGERPEVRYLVPKLGNAGASSPPAPIPSASSARAAASASSRAWPAPCTAPGCPSSPAPTPWASRG